MLNLLKQLHDKAEELRGRHLVFVLIGAFIIFLFIGIFVPIFFDFSRLGLNKAEPKKTGTITDANSQQAKLYKGVITYVGEDMYKTEKIKYVLTDVSGKELMLLTATDSKLQIFEGIPVGVKGTVTKTSAGKDILAVTEVIFDK